jgi:hypothetical protein
MFRRLILFGSALVLASGLWAQTNPASATLTQGKANPTFAVAGIFRLFCDDFRV